MSRICSLGVGFPEFTRSVILAFAKKLRYGVELTVAVRAHDDALVEFLANALPTSGVAVLRNPEVLLGGVHVMELKCLYATVIATTAALAALVRYGHTPNLPTPLSNRGNHIGSAVCITPLFHRHAHAPSQSAALPTELPGNNRGVSCQSGDVEGMPDVDAQLYHKGYGRTAFALKVAPTQ
jgi:hypothetical protein